MVTTAVHGRRRRWKKKKRNMKLIKLKESIFENCPWPEVFALCEKSTSKDVEVLFSLVGG